MQEGTVTRTQCTAVLRTECETLERHMRDLQRREPHGWEAQFETMENLLLEKQRELLKRLDRARG